MKLFSKMLTRKPDPEETAAQLEMRAQAEEKIRRGEGTADDSGQVNGSVKSRSPEFADATKPIHSREEEPEEVEGAGWVDDGWSDEDWDDEEDWGDEELSEDGYVQPTASPDDKSMLVDEIRGAVGAVGRVTSEGQAQARRDLIASQQDIEDSDWSNDEDFGRRAIARSQLDSVVTSSEDRILSETNSKMGERETSRRRSAMAHLKAAAAATKADRVLKHVAGRDSAADPQEQSPYRDDLAKVVRPQSTSRPISRPVSRPRPEPATWDHGNADQDAAMFAAASEDSLMPSDDETFEMDDAMESDFADDNFDDQIASDDHADEADTPEISDEENWSSRFASDDDVEEEHGFSDVFNDDDPEDDFDDDFDIAQDLDDDGQVPSSVVSETVALASAAVEKTDIPEPAPVPEDDVVRRKLADVVGEGSKVELQNNTPEAVEEEFVNISTAVAAGRSGRNAGRVKTRLLGFQDPTDDAKDIFAAAEEQKQAVEQKFPVGWIVVIDGPGRGHSYTLFNGVSNIGRGEDQAVRLDFGDNSISRNNHAAVAYDDEQGKFFLGHGGKSNLVRLNGKPVLSTEDMDHGDEIRIGETTLKFVALCNPEFTWQDADKEDLDA